MIKERFMVTGQTLGNPFEPSKTVTGYFALVPVIYDECRHSEMIVPGSFEPVAVKVKGRFQSNDGEFAGHCPNCDKNVHSWTGEYCSGCGQRLDWGE